MTGPEVVRVPGLVNALLRAMLDVPASQRRYVEFVLPPAMIRGLEEEQVEAQRRAGVGIQPAPRPGEPVTTQTTIFDRPVIPDADGVRPWIRYPVNLAPGRLYPPVPAGTPPRRAGLGQRVRGRIRGWLR